MLDKLITFPLQKKHQDCKATEGRKKAGQKSLLKLVARLDETAFPALIRGGRRQKPLAARGKPVNRHKDQTKKRGVETPP
jgi:hypothetical protein